MVRWTGFAALSFATSARLAFARAIESADTDAHEQHPEAWVIDDRRITLSAVDIETSRASFEGTKRLLAALVLDATEGEAVVEAPELEERWARKAASPSISKEITVAEDSDAMQTIRTEVS